MKGILITFFSFVIGGLFISCFDLYQKHYEIDEPYFVASDPVTNTKTLYYDLKDGNAIQRVNNVKKVGHTEKRIIVEVQDGYYLIDRQKDNEYLNSNEIIGSIKSHKYFHHYLDSLKINDFNFLVIVLRSKFLVSPVLHYKYFLLSLQ